MVDKTCLFTLVDKLRVVWEITHKCNYICLHCCADAKSKGDGELTLNSVKKGVDNLVAHGLGSIYFSGGEPLTRKDFLEILTYAAALIPPKSINFATNGRLVTPEIAKRVSQLDIGNVLVSLDGHDSETAQKFRGIKECYVDAVNAISRLADEDVKVRLGVVIWAGNYRHLEEFIKIGIDVGANNIFFNWLVPIGRAKGNDKIELDLSLYFNIAHELESLRQKYGDKISVGFHRFEQLDDMDENCQAGIKILHIIPDGRVSPCSWIYKVDNHVLSKQKISEASLDEILKEEPFELIRQMQGDRLKCGSGPGCLAMCKAFAGDYLTIDPLYKNGGLWVKKNES